jgi:hypothetical protein
MTLHVEDVLLVEFYVQVERTTLETNHLHGIDLVHVVGDYGAQNKMSFHC